jgi:large subunit ribosomal protein L9
VKAGKEGKLFGSITSKDITEIILNKYKIGLDKKKIDLKESLKKLGVHNISINLYKDVVSQIKVNLISDSLSEQEQQIEDTKEE